MKFSFYISVYLIVIYINFCHQLELENTIENINQIDSEYLNKLHKECDKISAENQALCEKLQKMDLQYRTTINSKVMSKVEAIFYNNEHNSTKSGKNDLFNLAMPINTCRNEDCEFCCLSTNRCGSKKQCQNREEYMKYINGFFISLCIILLICLMVKCYQIDPNPDQNNTEKIDNNDLNELINMFSIIRNNRKKLIT